MQNGRMLGSCSLMHYFIYLFTTLLKFDKFVLNDSVSNCDLYITIFSHNFNFLLNFEKFMHNDNFSFFSH